MPSRKKDRGRERREKKAKANCTHGYSGDDTRFMVDFRTLWSEEIFRKAPDSQSYKHVDERRNLLTANAAIDAMSTVAERYPEVMRDAAYRSDLIAGLLGDGVGYLLNYSEDGRGKTFAGGVAGAIKAAESYRISTSLDERDKEVIMRERDVSWGCEKGVVEFYRDRIPCSCLDELWETVRSRQRTSLCPQCYERKPRSTFLICTGCESQQYCSKACAAAGWPWHKEGCIKRRQHVESIRAKRAEEAGAGPQRTTGDAAEAEASEDGSQAKKVGPPKFTGEMVKEIMEGKAKWSSWGGYRRH